MEFKFRDRVRVKPMASKLLRPDGVPSQSEFFAGSEGIVIRHDPAKGGYLIVLDCPEVSSAMGETITAYFNEYELEAFPQIAFPVPDAAKPGPFEYSSETDPCPPEPLTQWQRTKAKANQVKRLGDV